MQTLLDTLNTLHGYWLFDMEVYSKPIMYWPFLIPAVVYTAFFLAKWAVITVPIWLPIKLMQGTNININTK